MFIEYRWWSTEACRENLFWFYTLGKKGCYTPIEDNKTNVDRTFCVSTWLKLVWYGPAIVPQRNPTLPWADIQCKVKWDCRAPKPQYRWSFPQINLHTVTTLNQYLHIFSKVFLIVRTMPRPTPMSIRHEVFALAREGIKQGAIAARVGLTRATVNRILKRHAATGSLVPGKCSEAPRKTTPRQDRALLRMVRQDRFLSARALTAWMRNLYGMRAGRTTVNNRLLSRGYRAYRPTTKPLLTANHRRLRLNWAQRWRNLTVAHWQHVIFGDESRFQLYPVDGRLRVRLVRASGQGARLIRSKLVVVRSTYGELSTIAPNPLLCSRTDISPVCSIGAFCKTP